MKYKLCSLDKDYFIIDTQIWKRCSKRVQVYTLFLPNLCFLTPPEFNTDGFKVIAISDTLEELKLKVSYLFL